MHQGGERHCESYMFCLRTQRGIARNLGQDGGRACASFSVMALKVLKIMYGENDFFENISFSMRWIPCAQLETYSTWASRVIDKEKC